MDERKERQGYGLELMFNRTAARQVGQDRDQSKTRREARKVCLDPLPRPSDARDGVNCGFRPGTISVVDSWTHLYQRGRGCESTEIKRRWSG